jgi:hypothetical protein
MTEGGAAWRVLRLAILVNTRSKLKFVLLTVLIAVSSLVFLAVTELSRASTVNLDEAIDSDLGVAGTYRVEPSAELGLTLQEALDVVDAAAAPFSREPVKVALRFPAVRPECPPFNQLGDVSAAILFDQRGRPAPFQAGGGGLTDADLCLAGLVVPNISIREASTYEKKSYDTSIVIDPLYEEQLRLTSTDPPRYAFVVTTGLTSDQTAELRNALKVSFSDAAAKASIDSDNAVVVARVDSGDSVRSASAGIRLVYALIAWGVLIIGGIGVLVAELIVLRDRTWFFGLARAVGARRWNVAWLILADILLVLTAGLTAAILTLTVASPWVARFGRDAFQVELNILRGSAVPGLALGLAFVMLLGGAYPAWRATRLDPLDVLENR